MSGEYSDCDVLCNILVFYVILSFLCKVLECQGETSDELELVSLLFQVVYGGPEGGGRIDAPIARVIWPSSIWLICPFNNMTVLAVIISLFFAGTATDRLPRRNSRYIGTDSLTGKVGGGLRPGDNREREEVGEHAKT